MPIDIQKSLAAGAINGALFYSMAPTNNMVVNVLGAIYSPPVWAVGIGVGATVSAASDVASAVNFPLTNLIPKSENMSGLLFNSMIHGIGNVALLYALNPNIFSDQGMSVFTALTIGGFSEFGAHMVTGA